MTELHRFMEIDTCPMCGNEIWLRKNEHVGKKLEEIPADTVFEIGCTDKTGTNPTCGVFRITKRDQTSPDNDWMAEYIPVAINLG